jgi:hypothetical protein
MANGKASILFALVLYLGSELEHCLMPTLQRLNPQNFEKS